MSNDASTNDPPAPARRRLPDKRSADRQKILIGGRGMYLDVGEFSDGSLGEIFIDTAKGGTELRALYSLLSTAISVGLQHGVPLSVWVDLFVGVRFPPQGAVMCVEEVQGALSPIDAIFKILALRYDEPLPDDTVGVS